MQPDERFKKIPNNEQPTGKNGDRITVLVTIVLLVSIVANSPNSAKQTITTDTTQTKPKTTVVTPDTLHIEQGVFTFDSLEIVKKVRQNIK